MRRMGWRFSALLLSGLLLGAGGCSTLEGLPQASTVPEMAPAAEPALAVGDRSYFTNGRRLEVTGLSGGLAEWKRSARRHYRSTNNFLLPPAIEESAKKRIANTLDAPLSSIWPLTLGQELSFSLQRVSDDRTSGERGESRRYWDCEVDAAQRITVVAGRFDTYRVDCTRRTASHKFRQRRIWFYAPDIGQPVLRLDYYRENRRRRLEMTAFVPVLPGLSDASSRDYLDSFQKVMETAGSGEKMVWTDTRGDAQITVTPLRTVRWQDGTYCRNYRQRLRIADHARQGAGLVCRTADGSWRIPRSIKRQGGVRF